MVKVQLGDTFEKTGERMIEFDVTHLIQKTEKELMILLFIANQDEDKAMKNLGYFRFAKP